MHLGALDVAISYIVLTYMYSSHVHLDIYIYIYMQMPSVPMYTLEGHLVSSNDYLVGVSRITFFTNVLWEH